MASTAGRRGSVRKDRVRGTYYVVVDVAGVGAERRQQVRRRGFATERAARTALTALLGELDAGSYVRPDPAVTVSGYATANWLPALKVRGRRPSTLESYERNLRVHVFPRIGHRAVADVQPPELDQLYVELLGGARGRRPLAPRSGAVSTRSCTACSVTPCSRATPPPTRAYAPMRPSRGFAAAGR